MTRKFSVRDRVDRYYRQDDFNCATTTLKILSEKFDLPLNSQIFDAALGMHGAGGLQAQCGLVEGGLLFIGILGRARGVADDRIVNLCKDFGRNFEIQFSSLQCRLLRPEGFKPDTPPHLCEQLTCRAIRFTMDFIAGSDIFTTDW